MNMAVYLGGWVGALGALLLLGLIVRALLRVVLRRKELGRPMVALCFAIAAVVAVCLGALGFADGGALNWDRAAVTYLPPALVLTVVSLLWTPARKAKVAG